MSTINNPIIGYCRKCKKALHQNHPYVWCDSCNEPISDEVNLKRSPSGAAAETAKLEAQIQSVITTTAPSLEGYRVVKTIEIITAECAFGMNIFQDIFAGLSDVLGGRSETTQKVLREARRVCLYELKKEAAGIGADAVIAVSLNYSEFSGKGKSMLFLVASGTAVKIEPVSKEA